MPDLARQIGAAQCSGCRATQEEQAGGGAFTRGLDRAPELCARRQGGARPWAGRGDARGHTRVRLLRGRHIAAEALPSSARPVRSLTLTPIRTRTLILTRSLILTRPLTLALTLTRAQTLTLIRHFRALIDQYMQEPRHLTATVLLIDCTRGLCAAEPPPLPTLTLALALTFTFKVTSTSPPFAPLPSTSRRA